VIGDGRFLGLGVLAPVRRAHRVHAFEIVEGLADGGDPAEIARAARRAVMARVQGLLGRRERLPAFFTGHEGDGTPARSQNHPHLAFAFDPTVPRLLVLAPHRLERRDARSGEERHLARLDEALEGFVDLRAGRSGRLTLRATHVDIDTDPLFAPSRTWTTITPYVVTRHAKRVGASEALAADVKAECRRRQIPAPRVTARSLHGVNGLGLTAKLDLEFAVAIEGPLLLGRTRHEGGGLFVRAGASAEQNEKTPLPRERSELAGVDWSFDDSDDR
jgi:CRISPR-associated protein Csb2